MSDPEIKTRTNLIQAAKNHRAPSSPLLSAERVGEHEPSLEHPQPTAHGHESVGAANQGPNLIVIYGLIAFALVAAIGIAIMIVLPFYQRR
jgi:hypothetical protein